MDYKKNLLSEDSLVIGGTLENAVSILCKKE